MKIVFAGGGTAGHVTPNVALINNLDKTDKVWYFGGDGIEKSLVKSQTAANYVKISAPKFARKFTLKNLAIPFCLAKSITYCKKQLKSICPDVVFAKGGYLSLPVVAAAKSLKIPVVVHESDISVGLANKLCGGKNVLKLTAFPTTKWKNSVCVGAPLRKQIYSADAKNGLKTMGFDGKKPVLLFLGGSLGAVQLNNLAFDVAPALKNEFDIFVVTGKGKKIRADGVRSAEFVDNIFDLYKAASLCVTRGGANTLFELTAAGVPFVVIPLKKGSRGEQLQNAKYFCEVGCGKIFDSDSDDLVSVVRYVEKNKYVFKDAARRQKADGTPKITEILKQTAKNHALPAIRG